MELLAQGWPLAAAAREVGVVRTTAYIWRDGTTVRHKDGTVKVVPPLEPFALRPISPRFLSEDERIQIAVGGHGPSQRRLDVHPDTSRPDSVGLVPPQLDRSNCARSGRPLTTAVPKSVADGNGSKRMSRIETA